MTYPSLPSAFAISTRRRRDTYVLKAYILTHLSADTLRLLLKRREAILQAWKVRARNFKKCHVCSHLMLKPSGYLASCGNISSGRHILQTK